MTLRVLAFAAALALPALAGCTWEGRPDGAQAVHTPRGDYYGDVRRSNGVSDVPVVDVPVVEPGLGDEALPSAAATADAPVPLDQPAPTTGTADNTTEVEEALTPGTEQ
ncbi:hypothetical protein RQM47_09160 [Rubrivirga sp. S365]|uniref:Lipoprotein n=1 Tax=Rubrivirga litoralis TaxID=3075598 RepID=A0ABU3BSD3_9BACT|nr:MULTISPECIES: hypothetical protein [unclassified Rubrivirga]MDT0632197.1 hypothetical protein [Rubrivirga sp. F394]MDT7856807.1 hypothetical protein [Rubrivirga sp. S365]